MAVHVDLVETRWSSGHQERVARVTLAEGSIEVAGKGHWEELVRDFLESADLTEDGEALEAVANHFKGDYAHATSPHEDDQCPFADGDRLPFEASPTSTREAEAAAT